MSVENAKTGLIRTRPINITRSRIKSEKIVDEVPMIPVVKFCTPVVHA